MKNSIRWLLTESKISSLDPQKVNYVNGKLICYHLTSHQNWANYNPSIKDKLENPLIKHPKQETSSDDSRAVRILKNLKNSNRVSARDSYDIEEEVIMDMLDDPYTDTSGFSPGDGDHHGKGLYTCYKFNPGIARTYGDICLAFEIDISNFVITFEDLARQVHGEDWRIKDQLLKLYKRNPRDEESLEKFLKILDRVGFDKLELNQTINKMRPHSSQISYALMKAFGKELITAVYDGIIFLGRGDGPVCVSFYPKYDARLVGLGRLSKRSSKADVDWYDSLNDFLGGRARNKLDFQTMNDVAEENTSIEEKEQMKEDERIFYDAKHNYVLFSLENIRYTGETIQKLVEFYEEVKSSNIEGGLDVFYREIGTGKFTQSYKEFDSLSQKVLQEYGKILEDAYQFYKSKNNIDEVSEMLRNTGYVLNLMSSINFSSDFLVNGVYSAFKKSFKEIDEFEYHSRTAANFLKSASSYISNANAPEEFVQLIQELDDTYSIDLKLKTADWIELIDLYENSNQKTKDKIINLTDRISDHPLKIMSTPDPDNPGEFKQADYYKSKEVIDKFCNIIDIMIKKHNANVLRDLYHAFKNVEHPLSDTIIGKAVEELIALPETDSDKKILTAYLIGYFEKFGINNSEISEKFNSVKSEMFRTVENSFNKAIANLEKKTKPQGSFFNYYYMRNDGLNNNYLKSQSKEWHERLINLIIENIKTNPKFAKLKLQILETVIYLIDLKDIVLSEQDQRILSNSSGKNGVLLLSYRHISQSVSVDIIIGVLQKNSKSALNSIQLSSSFFENFYQSKKLLDAFIQYSDKSFFERTVQRLVESLKGNKVELLCGNYYQHTETSKIDLSEVINPNDNVWYNYLLGEIRVKTNSGKTKKAGKLFKELDTLMSQRNVSQESGEPELDLSHREIFGNSLKEVYNFQGETLDESVITNIKNFFARPKFNGDKLVVYHRTTFEDLIKYNPYLSSEDNKDDVENLKESEKLEKALQDIIGDPLKRGSGFQPGVRMLHGRGLYSCYTFKKNQAEGYGNIILAFDVDISNYLIGDRNLAIRVHGINFTPKQQFLKIIKKRYPEKLDFFKEQWEIQFSGLDDATNTDPDYNIQDFFENDAGTKRFLIFEKIFRGYIFKDEKDGDVCVSFNPEDDVQVYKIGVEGSIFQDHQVSSRYRGKLVWHDSLDSLLQGKSKNKDSFKTINKQKNKDKTQTKDDEQSNNQIIADQILRSHNLNHMKIAFEKSSDLKDLITCFEKSPEIHGSTGKLDADNRDLKNKFQISDFNINNDNMKNNELDKILDTASGKNYNFYYEVILAFFENSKHKDFYVVNAINNIISLITKNSRIKIKSADTNKIIKIINDNQEYKKYFLNKLAKIIGRYGRFQQKNKETLIQLLKNTLINLDLSDSDLNNLKFENKIYKVKSLKEVYNF